MGVGASWPAMGDAPISSMKARRAAARSKNNLRITNLIDTVFAHTKQNVRAKVFELGKDEK